jgi:hypothetical protein
LPTSQWWPNAPATPAELQALQDKYRIELPADYRELLLFSSGGGVYGDPSKLNLETAAELLWHNEDPRFAQHLPGMFVIGDDNGDCVVFYDPANRLGYGPYALYLMDLGQPGLANCRYLAPELRALIEAVLGGESLRDRPRLKSAGHAT